MPAETALLVIDVQNTYRKRPDRAAPLARRSRRTSISGRRSTSGWRSTVIPNTRDLLAPLPRERHRLPLRAHRQPDAAGRERSLSHRKPGWNDLLLPKDDWESQIVDELAPQPATRSSCTR